MTDGYNKLGWHPNLFVPFLLSVLFSTISPVTSYTFIFFQYINFLAKTSSIDFLSLVTHIAMTITRIE